MAADSSKQPVYPDRRDTAVASYSPALEVGDFVFVSGQGPLNFESLKFECSTIESQTQRTLENVKKVLAAADCRMEDVVKISIFLQNINDFEQVDAIYQQYFSKPWPARTTVQAILGAGISIEIDAIAVRGCGTPFDQTVVV